MDTYPSNLVQVKAGGTLEAEAIERDPSLWETSASQAEGRRFEPGFPLHSPSQSNDASGEEASPSDDGEPPLVRRRTNPPPFALSWWEWVGFRLELARDLREIRASARSAPDHCRHRARTRARWALMSLRNGDLGGLHFWLRGARQWAGDRGVAS